MSDDLASLLAEILADPRSNGPRLRYADAVEQSDPARAELIRLQIRDAGSPEPDWPARNRVGQLLEEHRSRWTADIAPLVEACRLQRGFVEYVALPAPEWLDRAEEITSSAPILDLRLTGVAACARELFGSATLSGLRALDLSRDDLGDDEAKLLARSPWVSRLAWLDLSNNRIGRAGLDALAASEHLADLQWLGFRRNEAPDPTPQVADDFGRTWFTERPELGRELEARHGKRPWLERGFATTPRPAEVEPPVGR